MPLFLSLFIIFMCFFYIAYLTDWFSAAFIVYCVALVCSLLVVYLSSDFVGLFLGFVALNMCLYGLMVKGYAFATDAAVRYFLLGSVAMCFFFFGVALHFCLYGSFKISSSVYVNSLLLFENHTAGLLFSQKLVYLCVLVLFFFKLGVFPFHFYVPSIYTAVDYGVLGIYSIPVNLALFFSFVNFLELLGSCSVLFYPVLLSVGVGSLFVGTLGALRQVSLSSFWAYSYVSSMGFVFIGFTVSSNTLVTSAATAYFLQYLTTWVLLFWFFGIFGQTPANPDTVRSFQTTPLVYISDLSIVGSPTTANAPLICICVLLASLAGLPPTVGFVFKFGVLSTLSTTLVGLLVLPSVLILLPIGAFNYLRLLASSVSGVGLPHHESTLRALVLNESFMYLYAASIVFVFIYPVALVLPFVIYAFTCFVTFWGSVFYTLITFILIAFPVYSLNEYFVATERLFDPSYSLNVADINN